MVAWCSVAQATLPPASTLKCLYAPLARACVTGRAEEGCADETGEVGGGKRKLDRPNEVS